MIKLMHGDCLSKMKEIPDGSIDMVLTDPPYGITACKWDSIIPLERMWKELNRVIKCNGAILLMAMQPFSSALVMSQPKMFKYEWVWQKECGTGFLYAKKQPLRNNESILVFYKIQPTYNPQFTKGDPYWCKQGTASDCYNNMQGGVTINHGKRYPVTIQKFRRDKGKFHPTQKPELLMEYLISTYTNPSDTVLDFTMGSGTTGVACKKLSRRFVGIELQREYFEIAKRRIDMMGFPLF